MFFTIWTGGTAKIGFLEEVEGSLDIQKYSFFFIMSLIKKKEYSCTSNKPSTSWTFNQ